MLELTGAWRGGSARPQVFHFAFRNQELFDRRWLDYGFVTRLGATTSILHINGFNDSYNVSGFDEPSRVETFFGPTQLIYRIASLHPFELRIRPPEESTGPSVRFPA